jgi:GH15 family glucan-1,4-alpha-glucosidase
MAWVAFDRAIHLIEEGNPGPLQRWRAIRDQIHAQVLDQGYDASRGVFTQYYGSTELDSSVLLIPEVGFLPPDDPRVVSTVRVLRRELMRDGLMLRYTLAGGSGGTADVDGLPGAEGAFLACSFWLVNALHQIGEHNEAVSVFERLLALRNDLGLLSEEYDPRYGRQVGNTPQAFSHVPLIQAALNLEGHATGHSRRVTTDRHGASAEPDGSLTDHADAPLGSAATADPA